MASIETAPDETASGKSATGALAGRTVIISGAGGGIGGAAVAACLAAGANVVATDLPGLGLKELSKLGERVLALEADVTSSDDWKRVGKAAIEKFGSISCLVNNAGIEGELTPLLEYSEEMFDRVQGVNVKGVFLGMKHIVPLFSGDGQAVVNTASVAGLGGARSLSAYVASKHAVVGLTKTAALEFSPLGVRCNAVCPAPIRTRMMDSLIDGLKSDEVNAEMIEAGIADSIPLGRIGDIEEVASLMVFLLSDAASFITGAAIPVDGGMRAR